MSTVIKVEHVSKQYRLGLVGSGTMRDDLEGWWHRVRGKEDPTLKLGDVNDRSTAGDSNYVWALRDINFEVQQGEVLGIIGKNGAGKSTLLKLLSRVTAPTIGHIKVKGRIASLLEVGTGFHPELTGKENIFLNGAIMGMKKHEIARKLDEIVDFAGVERYLETPVKRYSSGMYVRLAFAVAAHLEPEIIIVDEVLAVGDVEFQKKCLGKMQSVSQSEGRTVLFVSHNMAFVNNLCDRCLYLSNGTIIDTGLTQQIVSRYLSDSSNSIKRLPLADEESIEFRSIDFLDEGGSHIETLGLHEEVRAVVKFNVLRSLDEVSFSIGFNNVSGLRVLSYWTRFINTVVDLKRGTVEVCFSFTNKLTPGVYDLVVYADSRGRIIEHVQNARRITVTIADSKRFSVLPTESQGVVVEDFHFSVLS